VEARRGHNKIQGNRSCIIFVTTTCGTFVMFSFQSYTVYNAQVETKKLDELLSEVRKDIESMMDRKCDAIKVNMLLQLDNSVVHMFFNFFDWTSLKGVVYF
jgi:hypothetical protein